MSLSKAWAGARAFIGEDDAAGELLGSWRTEIGQLGRLLLLRGFETAEELAAERRRALLSVDPFHAGGIVTALSMESYALFPFLPPIQPKSMGGIYEFRTYRLKPGGLPPTLARQPLPVGKRQSSRPVSTPVISLLTCTRWTGHHGLPILGASRVWNNARCSARSFMLLGSGRLREAQNRLRKQLRRLPCRRTHLRFVDAPNWGGLTYPPPKKNVNLYFNTVLREKPHKTVNIRITHHSTGPARIAVQAGEFKR